MAATAVINNALPQSKSPPEKQANASSSDVSAPKADAVPLLASTNGLADNIDNAHFKELQKYVRPQQWRIGTWSFAMACFLIYGANIGC